MSAPSLARAAVADLAELLALDVTCTGRLVTAGTAFDSTSMVSRR